jgi:hypothetical protein
MEHYTVSTTEENKSAMVRWPSGTSYSLDTDQTLRELCAHFKLTKSGIQRLLVDLALDHCTFKQLKAAVTEEQED